MKLIALFLIAIACAFAQTPISLDGEQRAIDAQLIPTSPTNILTVTVNVLGVHLINEGASDTTCVIVDRQNTPRAITSSTTAPLTVASGQSHVMAFPFRRRALNGITWSCAANTVTGYILYELPH